MITTQSTNEILVRKVADKSFTVEADGKKREGFRSWEDAREWAGCMQAHGLFLGYLLYRVTDLGHKILMEPKYDYPCQTPAICR